MPAKKPHPLPDSLKYLQPFTNVLAKLPSDYPTDGVNPSRLETALRKRVKNLDEETAEDELTKDRDLLEQWLIDKPDHPAHWILGFLFSPTDLLPTLFQNSEPLDPGPKITFEPPTGWKIKPVPFRLDFKAGKLLGSIMAIDESTFQHLHSVYQNKAKVHNPAVQIESKITDVAFEPCRGKKYLRRTTSPISWKEISYLLEVPGGHIDLSIGTTSGIDFDETLLERHLHTLKLSTT